MKARLIALGLAVSATLAATSAFAQSAQRPPVKTPVPVAPEFVPPKEGINPNELAVNVANRSVPVLCAEKDNVELTRMWHYNAVHAPDTRLKSYKKKLDQRINNLKDRDKQRQGQEK